MTVYLITFLISVLFSRMAEDQYEPDSSISEQYVVYVEKNTGIYFFLAGCALVFVSGLRYKVGTDYWTYYNGYNGYINRLFHSIVSLDEPGYGILAWIATRFVNDGAAVIFVSALVTISLPLTVIYKNTKNLSVALALFVLMGFWHGSFNGVRQYLAASVLFCGYNYLKEKQLLKYFLVVCIAFLFHRSAIVMLFLYPVVHRKINQVNILLSAAVLAVFSFYSRSMFSVAGWIMEKQYSLNNGYTSHQVNIIRVVAACIPAIIFLVLYWGEELSDSETFYLNLLIVHAAIRLFTMNSALLYRVGIYTTAFAVIAIAELLEGLHDSNRKIVTAGILAMYFGMWWYELAGTSSLNYFQWIWQR